MSEKKRILFSSETGDKWILQAYKSLFDTLPKDNYELFCTACYTDENIEELIKYNIIDFDTKQIKSHRIYSNALSSVPTEKQLLQSQKLSIWAKPELLLKRFFLFREAFNLIRPDVVIVWNGMADVRGMISSFLSENNFPFFFSEKGMLPESWYIDEEGINAESSLDSTFLKNKFSPIEFEKTETYIKSVIESGSSAWEQPERIEEKNKLKESFGIGDNSNIIFFPGQVDEDVNITRFSVFNNIAEAVKLVLDNIPENCCLVVKPHPKSKEDSRKRLESLSQGYQNLRIVSDINVWDIIEVCDLVISINSTVAFEALLRNRRVLLLGDGVLSKTDLCRKVNHIELCTEIQKCLEAKFQSSAEYVKALSFVKFLREHYYIFRNADELPVSVLSKIDEKAGNVSDKKYDRQEIIKMLYNEEAGNNKQICNIESAVDCFIKAQNEYERDNFSHAVKYIEKYNSLMDYSRLEKKSEQNSGNIDVSVVIVTYNRKDELIQCLETVSNQDTDNYEVIVVDNGGCEYESIKQYVSQYIKCPINFNLSEGRNIGVHFAQGKIVAFLDDDTFVEPGYISSIKSAFDKYDIVGLRGRTLPKNKVDYIVGSNIYDLGNTPFPSYCNQEGNSAWLRDIYVSMGCMDPLLFGHEGSDLTYRIIKKYNEPGKVIYWPETIIYHNYPTKETAGTKYILHQRSGNYLKIKHNANIFANRKEIERFPIYNTTCRGLPAHENAGWKPATQVEAASGEHKPRVSVIIACHNCGKYLPACIESIRNQTMNDWELFLLDDASSDDTKNIIEKFSKIDQRIKPYYFEDNRGPYVRRNYGIERAASDFIVIQDSDDIMHPQKLEKLYNEITRNERLGVVGSFYLMALDEFKDIRYCDKIELPVTHSEIMENYNSNIYVCWHGSAIIRKSLFETIGLYDEHPYGSDKFWLAKAAEYSRSTNRIEFKNIPEYLTYKIEHSSSQQGQLPNLDPRSRRAKFQTYWLYKLMKIREKVIQNPGTNICSELRNCKCNDYISKYGHLFEQWEKEKLDNDSISIYTIRAVDRFNEYNFVSCIITLDSVEKISSDVAKRKKNYNLLRAMAYYAIDRKERALEYLNLEIKTHESPAARQFLNDGFGEHNIDNLHVWIENNADKYDLSIIDMCGHSANKPLVSVIIPAYNAAEYISDAIKSVLTQDYKNFELIIINDGSIDDTEQIIKSFKDDRIRYMSQENRGLAATHNTGIRKAQGEFIIKLDCDDMMTPDFISKHIKQFTEHPEADLVYCDDYLIDENANPIRIIERPEYSNRNILIRDLFKNGFPVVPFRTCIKRSVFDKIGFFDEGLLIGEDYDMMRKFVRQGLNIHHLKESLYLRRLNRQSLSKSYSRKKAENLFEILERYTDTFDYNELFPDIDWMQVAPGKELLYAKCLTAETFIEIGKTYLTSKDSYIYAYVAFEKAKQEYEKCLEIEPENPFIQKIVQQFILDKVRIDEDKMQTIL